MKKLTPLILLLCLTSAFSAEKKGSPMEYSTTEDFHAGLRGGKIPPDRFFWGNIPNDRTLTPKPSVEAGVPIIEIAGSDNPQLSRAALASFVARVITVPKDKTTAAISLELWYEFDLWAQAKHSANTTGDIPFITVSFGDGTRLCADIAIPFTGPARAWNAPSATVDIPPGANFLCLTITAPGGSIAKIRGINVFFE